MSTWCLHGLPRCLLHSRPAASSMRGYEVVKLKIDFCMSAWYKLQLLIYMSLYVESLVHLSAVVLLKWFKS